MRIVSWNVNGIRAVAGKGFADAVKAMDADIIGIQETKAQIDQLGPEITALADYFGRSIVIQLNKINLLAVTRVAVVIVINAVACNIRQPTAAFDVDAVFHTAPGCFNRNVRDRLAGDTGVIAEVFDFG